MEVSRDFEPNEPRSFRRKVIGGIIAGFHFVWHQLETSDQNPNEARLRRSGMPSQYLDIPDFPPVEEDII